VKCVFVEEFVQLYGGPTTNLAGALIVSATVVWQVRVGNADVKKDIKEDIKKDIKAVDEKLDAVDEKVDTIRMELQHVQSIALGSAYAAMRAISGDRTLMKTWMVHIEKCVESGGNDCAAVKGIVEVYKKQHLLKEQTKP